MTRKTVTAALAIVMLGATALTTTDAFAFRPTHRVAAFKVAPRATGAVRAAPRHVVVKATPRYASFKASHKYVAPRSFPIPKADLGSSFLPKIDPGSVSKVTNPGKSDPGSSFLPKIDPSSLSKTVTNKPPAWQLPAGAGAKLSDAIPKASPVKTPAMPGDKLGKLPTSKPGPLTTPAPGPGDKLADKIKPQQKDPGSPSNPGKPGDNHWPSKNWPGGPVVEVPTPGPVEQSSSVSVPERVVTTERVVTERPVPVIPRAVDNGAPACGMPALAAGIDALMPTSRLTATEFAMVKALRAAIADLAAAGNEAGARELEAQAMNVLGYKKVWLRCGQGAFTWERLLAAG
jgi:hypothetical protein